MKLENDTEYKKYTSLMEKALLSFDGMTEWQDIIGFLVKILKILNSFKQYSAIPQKMLLSKRLAQTLNPALPAGVHQKALEAYDAVFENTRTTENSIDICLWSVGLFPFMQVSSLSSKVLLSKNSHYY